MAEGGIDEDSVKPKRRGQGSESFWRGELGRFPAGSVRPFLRARAAVEVSGSLLGSVGSVSTPLPAEEGLRGQEHRQNRPGPATGLENAWGQAASGTEPCARGT